MDMTVYCGDDYPREGCTLTVDVCAGGYDLQVNAPNGNPIEIYATARSPRQLARMVEEWCSGQKPKLHHPSDQSGPVST